MPLFDALKRILSRLEGHGAGAALIGGLAVSAWTEPRFTRDIDLAVAVHTDNDAERLVRALGVAGFRLIATVEQKATGRLATARLLPPGGSADEVIVDLLFASSGIEPEIVEQAAAIDVGAGVSVPVTRIGHLVALKLLAHDEVTRPVDAIDLRALRSLVDATETRRAQHACDLITERGYHRGRDLRKALEAFLKTAPAS